MTHRVAFLASFAALSFGAVACSHRAPLEDPATVAARNAPPAPPPVKHDIPTSCAEGEGKSCLLDSAFVDAVCSAEYPDVALHLFSKKSPAAHVYLKNDTEAWNASGGRSHRAKMLFGEEVVVLRKRTPKGSVVIVGQGATYEVLRWNGDCVSLGEEEISPTRLGPPKRASIIPWHKLEDATRTALKGAQKVKTLDEKAATTCDDPSAKACEKAELARELAVTEALRDGKVQLPLPGKRP